MTDKITVYAAKDERWPDWVLSIRKDALTIPIEVPPTLLKEYNRVTAKYNAVQKTIENIVNGVAPDETSQGEQ